MIDWLIFLSHFFTRPHFFLSSCYCCLNDIHFDLDLVFFFGSYRIKYMLKHMKKKHNRVYLNAMELVNAHMKYTHKRPFVFVLSWFINVSMQQYNPLEFTSLLLLALFVAHSSFSPAHTKHSRITNRNALILTFHRRRENGVKHTYLPALFNSV